MQRRDGGSFNVSHAWAAKRGGPIPIKLFLCVVFHIMFACWWIMTAVRDLSIAKFDRRS